MFLAKKLNKGAGTVALTLDPQFNYVTMLLHGDGTNGAQNNTFLDSSSSARTVTRVGTPTQGSFSPYGDKWSNHFDGTGDYLSTPNVAALQPGTSTNPFCVECWVYPTSTPASDIAILGNYKVTSYPTNTDGFDILQTSSNQAALRWGYPNYADSGVSSAMTLNTWNHIAVCRNSSGSMSCYLNGTRWFNTSTNTSITNATASSFWVGWAGSLSGTTVNPFNGYISNVRLVKGSTPYDPTLSTLTVPTAPLTAITNTSLLTCADNRFIDDSGNGLTMTPAGNTSVQRFNPFGTATAYSTSVIGGSGYFNTGNYLSVTGLGTISSGDNYCYEMWVYPTEFRSGEMRLMGSNVNDPLLQFTSNTDLQFFVNNTFICGYSTTFYPNQWYHIAITKNAGTSYLFVNGIQRASGGNGFGINNKTFLIGAQETSPTIGLIGYMTDFRPWIGTAAYGSNFTPPTSPMTATAFNPLLLNFTNGAIFDNAMMSDLETVGNAQISTSVVKYGTGSLAFDGTGDYLYFIPTPQFVFGAGNFTVEAWTYFNDTTSSNAVISQCTTSGDPISLDLFLHSSEYFRCRVVIGGTTYTVISSTITPVSTWQHVAMVRDGSTLTLYLNGTSVGSTSIGTGSLGSSSTNRVAIGRLGEFNGQYMNGYIDDLRITKGYARYTATFTPPTSAFSDTGPY